MLFLRQIRAHGFKSFAEPTILDFTHEMIGVVGPNGSGKSNITDAIRWALGEQSAKSLRGSNLDDVVFSGSVDKPALDKAEVTLVFDNNRDFFSTLDTPIVEITRIFNKKTRDSEFLINGEKAKMRDVQDIALETGLTKSSIAIISQGTISTFAEAKPEQRREIFDEAAGVAKYKKRKKETLTKLIKTSENLSRIADITSEIGRRLPSLEKAASKAIKYKTLIEELQDYELSILVKDVKILKSNINDLREKRNVLEEKVETLSNEINFSEDEFEKIISETSSSDVVLVDLNAKFNSIVQRISNLRIKKVEAESRENTSLKNSTKDEIKQTEIKKQFEESKIAQNIEKDKQFKLSSRIDELKEKYEFISSKYNEVYDEKQDIVNTINKLKWEKQSLENNSKSSFGMNSNNGAKAIVEHSNNLTGVIGTLKSLVNVQEKYQVAISVVASSSMNSVVMKTNLDVKRAIEFLKRNQAGRATFLPLDTLNPSTIQGPQRTLIEEMDGFIGFANDLVSIDSKYQKALDYALGTILVVENYDYAVEIAKKLNYKFNIVSLEGERILPHGAIIGGKTKTQNIFSDQPKTNSIEDLVKTIEQLSIKEVEVQKQVNTYQSEIEIIREQISEVQSSIRASQQIDSALKEKIIELSDSYKVITGFGLLETNTTNTGESEVIKLTKEIAKLEAERDEIQIEINALSKNKNKYAEKQIELNKINSIKRQELSEMKDTLAQIIATLNGANEKILNYLQKLAEKYGLTEEAVLEMETKEFENESEIRQRIIYLTQQVNELGVVNIESIADYEAEKERFDYYEKQQAEIKEAVDKLETVIKEIDEAMEIQFKKVVDDVNGVLPDAFQKLFGGGTAELIYTEPENILETGIDIKVNPPGKKIENLNLLSGGEKSLVALSVLFSILKVRPLPLVILDEAEAPLDPANVERFARYVKQFTDNTQFIIVTHREGTMENCDVLFGVTMEQKGVTKMVKIKLVDAKELAEQI